MGQSILHSSSRNSANRRGFARRIALANLVPLLGFFACGDNNAIIEHGGPPMTQGGVGAACNGDTECRTGLKCDTTTHKCAAGHSTKEGESCTISDECAMGLYCAGGACAKAGSGMAGAACSSDADCGAGLKCAIVGFGLSCIAQGTGDVGADCKGAQDCFGGLGCYDGKCGFQPLGAPSVGPLWPGVTCSDDASTLQAYFRVPRGKDDGDFYRLPFPNDIRLKKGKPDLTGHPSPGAAILGFDVVDRYLRALEKDNDGWGRYGETFFRFSGEIDLSTVKNAVQIINLTAQSPLNALYYAYSTGGGAYICPNWLTVRGAPGGSYDEGSIYAVVLTNAVKGKGGATIKRGADLDAVLGGQMPSDMTLAAAWNAYAPLRAYAAAKSFDLATVLNVAVFTVGKPSAPMQKLEKAIDGAAPASAAMWTKCDANVASPCPQHDAARGCQAADPDFDELHALVTLPIYQAGKAPYLTPADGGGIGLDAMGNPMVARTEAVCLSLSVPKGAPPGGAWPVLVFAHGTGGSFRDHVAQGVAKDFAKGVDDGTGKIVKAAVLGIDQVEHGPRRGTSTDSPNNLFFNFANPAAARGNVMQGAADQLSLARFATTVTFDMASSPTGTAFKLGPTLGFWGHSQGATEGALAVPLSTFAGAALSGEGGSLIDALLTKTSPVNIAAAVPFALEDMAKDGTLVGGPHHPVLTLLQTYVDGADPVNYGAIIASAPLAGMNPHHVFQPYGQKDTYSPPAVEAVYAIAAGLTPVNHDASVMKADDIAGRPESAPPLSGNLTVGMKKITAALRQYAPAAGKDGHFVAFDVATARADTERFLAGVLNGSVPRVGM